LNLGVQKSGRSTVYQKLSFQQTVYGSIESDSCPVVVFEIFKLMLEIYEQLNGRSIPNCDNVA